MKNGKNKYFSVIICIFFVSAMMLSSFTNVNAMETRGIRIVAFDKATEQKKEVKLYNKSYAVIIGIDHYKNLKYDEQLSYAVRDAKGVEAVLNKSYKFDKIITLYNEKATKSNIMQVLSGDLSKINKEDSVFIFWAGHGYTESTDFGDLGYLLPFDGTFDESNLYTNISMTMIRDDISKRIAAKHIFFVMDSCYSGLLVTKRGAPRKSNRDFSYLAEITKEKVRQVLTAGSKEQQVLDGGPLGHSVFTGRFIEILENTEDFITATEISSMVKEKVFSDAKARSHTQTPKYGELFGVGDYVFVPSIEQKVEDTKAKINDMQKEIERLNALEKASLKAKDERAMRQAELEKRVIKAKLKAEQLRQEALEEDRRKREAEEKERSRQQQELVASKKAEGERLAMLSKKALEKRKSLGSVSMSSLSPEATIKEMREIDKKIKKIRVDFAKELYNSVSRIKKRYKPELSKINQMKQDEFETEKEFLDRRDSAMNTAHKNRSKELWELNRKINDEYDKQISPLTDLLKKLSSREFTIDADKLELELFKYDAQSNRYPVSVKMQKPIAGILVADASTSIPLSREKARSFKQYYQNDILRPEIKGRFATIDSFVISQATVFNDSSGEKYGIVSGSKQKGSKSNTDFKAGYRLKTFVDLITGSIVFDGEPKNSMEFVWIPNGCFNMGSSSGDSDERPVHKVCVDGFYMGRYEVTNGQYHAQGNKNHPVVNVSWDDAGSFARRLSGIFRLPTEAEWEYAARAGSSTAYYWGDNFDRSYANISGDSDGYERTSPVGSYKPNDFGLYDMIGNVWEWTADRYDDDYYSNSPANNPKGPGSGSYRVIRGCSWYYDFRYCRSASRYRFRPGKRYSNLGFRLVFSPGQ